MFIIFGFFYLFLTFLLWLCIKNTSYLFLRGATSIPDSRECLLLWHLLFVEKNCVSNYHYATPLSLSSWQKRILVSSKSLNDAANMSDVLTLFEQAKSPAIGL